MRSNPSSMLAHPGTPSPLPTSPPATSPWTLATRMPSTSSLILDLSLERTIGNVKKRNGLYYLSGIQAELILGTIARRAKPTGNSDGDYLEDRITFSEDKLMDSNSKAVMMAWEKPLMEAHAKAVCSGGGHILNIGFGMGLVDAAIQQYAPSTHTIVEAHPEVYDRMLRAGWGEKENANIIFGRWQDVLPQLKSYDGIFFDTYGEYYEDMREFHQHLPSLLKPGGIYSFFNGLCGGNAFFHVVYCQLVSLELESLGYSTQFIPLPVKNCLGEEVWEGVKHKYWQLDTYYLPVCQSIQDSE
ncbi:protein arginine N-methyltransferase 2 isoform X2 [Diospyros lotus]|uniref:protein arginine N-methyltransferase 2 isoform X2 n=1 Tax=Diospyros lotus TaxID=55363 RepID=UPI00225140B7|nr:protein arginine N-methyltransferase 2 isoform X2 [Diospyros lotus]